jgi:tetratricopeptide (TPR) repeat protein
MAQAAQFYLRYNNSHQLSDLESTIELYRKAHAKSNEKHGRYTSILINLAVALAELGEVSGAVDADRRYNESIDLLTIARRFMESRPQSDRPQNYPAVLISLGWLHLKRYRDSKTEDDFRASIEAYEHVRSSTPYASLQYSASLIEHAAILWSRCEVQPTRDDAGHLEQALAYLDEARAGNHSDLEEDCYKNLAAVHDLLHRETISKDLKKAMMHLNSAIEFNQLSVELLQRKSGPALSATLFNLAKQQFARYTASTEKNEADLNNAEMDYQKAKSLAEQEHGSEEFLDKIGRLADNIKQYKMTATFRRGS